MQLDLLGSFRLRLGGDSVRLPMNATRLVAFLALSDGFLLRRHIAGSLWGESTERQAAGSLRSALWRLHDISPVLIEIADSHLRLLPSVRVDLLESEKFAREVLAGDADLSAGAVDLGLLSRDLLPDLTEDWVLTRRDQYVQLRIRTLEALSLALSNLGNFGPAVHAGMLAVAAEPLRESANRALIVAHLAEGCVAAAARQYETVRRLLWDELGVEPSSETRALVVGVRTGTSPRPGTYR